MPLKNDREKENIIYWSMIETELRPLGSATFFTEWLLAKPFSFIMTQFPSCKTRNSCVSTAPSCCEDHFCKMIGWMQLYKSPMRLAVSFLQFSWIKERQDDMKSRGVKHPSWGLIPFCFICLWHIQIWKVICWVFVFFFTSLPEVYSLVWKNSFPNVQSHWFNVYILESTV